MHGTILRIDLRRDRRVGAAENASRLAAEAAEEPERERIRELMARCHRQRQGRIIEELLDLVTAFVTLEEEVG